MSNYVFINISDNHFKVWGFDCWQCDDGTGSITTYWGKIGKRMQYLQKHTKEYKRWYDAYDYCKKKVEEKFCNRYVAIPNWMYFQMIESPKGINKLIEIYKKMYSLGLKYFNNKELKKVS